MPHPRIWGIFDRGGSAVWKSVFNSVPSSDGGQHTLIPFKLFEQLGTGQIEIVTG